KKYGDDQGNADDLVQSYYDTAMVWKRKGRTKEAEAAGQQAIDAWKKTGSPKNTGGARMAGEWALVFAEKSFNSKFEPYKITETAKTPERMKAIKLALDKLTVDIQTPYLALDDYGVAEYSMAAKVRYGETMSKYGEKLSQAPTPKYILDIDKKNP